MKVEIKDRQVHSYTDWHEIVNRYKTFFLREDNFVDPQSQNWYETLKNLRKNSSHNFYSCGSETMIDRIKNGYSLPEISLRDMPVVTYDRPRPRFTDDPEGEFDNDMFVNGETEYFLSKPKKKSVGGVRMKIEISSAGRISDKTIAEYLLWVGQTIQAILARGYDVELSVFLVAHHQFHNHGKCVHNIVISKFGERVIFKDWSALFSPGGFRHFMFFDFMLAGKEKDLRLQSGLGTPVGNKWGVNWVEENRTLEITVDSHSNTFPAEQMTKELDEWKD